MPRFLNVSVCVIGSTTASKSSRIYRGGSGVVVGEMRGGNWGSINDSNSSVILIVEGLVILAKSSHGRQESNTSKYTGFHTHTHTQNEYCMEKV